MLVALTTLPIMNRAGKVSSLSGESESSLSSDSSSPLDDLREGAAVFNACAPAAVKLSASAGATVASGLDVLGHPPNVRILAEELPAKMATKIANSTATLDILMSLAVEEAC